MRDLRRRPVASLAYEVFVPVVVIGVVTTVVAAFVEPSAVMASVLATMVVGMLVSTLIMLQMAMALLTPKQSPLALGLALLLYLTHTVVLFGLFRVRESSEFHSQWFGWTVVGLSAVWITLHVRSVMRVRVSPESQG